MLRHLPDTAGLGVLLHDEGNFVYQLKQTSIYQDTVTINLSSLFVEVYYMGDFISSIFCSHLKKELLLAVKRQVMFAHFCGELNYWTEQLYHV